MEQFAIEDDYNKDEVMTVFGAMYDRWKEKETKNVENGAGRLGLDGLLTTNVEQLFNQLLVVLHYKGREKKRTKRFGNDIQSEKGNLYKR